MATATLEEQVTSAPPMPEVNVTDKTSCVSITFGSLGNTRKVSTSEVEVDADKSLIHVNKMLLDSPELKAISKHDAETRSTVLAISLPSFFRAGFYLVPIAAIPKVEDILKAAQSKRLYLVEAFLKTYKDHKAQAELRLKGLYQAADYPSASRVRACFIFEWTWLTFSTPSRLKEISAEFFAQEQAKAATHWQQATDEITLLLRSSLKDLVDHMVERLTPGDDLKPKRFHATTVTNLQEFLANFAIRNVTDDAQLDMIVKSAQQLLSGVDADLIRSNEAVRDSTKSGFELVKQCLDTLVTEAGSRKIVFESDDEV
jgi:hypothetical protein